MTRPITAVHRPVGRPALRRVVPARLGLGIRRPRDRLLGRPPGRGRLLRWTTPTSRTSWTCWQKHDLKVFAISNHLTGQAVCDDPIDERHRGILTDRVWGDGDAEGVRQRAAEEMKSTARAARRLGVDTVVGFTGSKIWKTVAMFPPVPTSMIEAGYQDFADRWNPILDVFDEAGVRFAHEVHPSEIAYDYWTTVAGDGGDRPPAGLRAQLGPEPLRLAGPRPGRLPLGLQGPDLPRRLQGREASGRQRPQRPDGLAPARGPTLGAAGTSCRPGTATSRGRPASGCSTPSGTTARSRSSGRTPGWTACVGAPEALAFVRRLAFDPPAAAFDAAFTSR